VIAYEQRMRELEAAWKADAAQLGEYVDGRLLQLSVADGYAWYRLSGWTESDVTVEWMEAWSPDGYQEAVLADGGVFPRWIIQRVLDKQDKNRRRWGY
jgi:hypothetical protein